MERILIVEDDEYVKNEGLLCGVSCKRSFDRAEFRHEIVTVTEMLGGQGD